MEKQLKTKEEIMIDYNIGGTNQWLKKTTDNVKAAMTEWGNQEYEKGVEDGKNSCRHNIAIGILIGGAISILTILVHFYL